MEITEREQTTMMEIRSDDAQKIRNKQKSANSLWAKLKDKLLP